MLQLNLELLLEVWRLLDNTTQILIRGANRETCNHVALLARDWPFLLNKEHAADKIKFAKRMKIKCLHMYVESSVDELIPFDGAGITHLTFGYSFNQPVDHLPASVTSLGFGHSFNRPVEHLPAGIAFLGFCDRFNQSVEHLPAGITRLSLGRAFKHSLGKLPMALTFLIVARIFQCPDGLPENLTIMKSTCIPRK